MKIGIFYPPSSARLSGNQVTALRWAAMLEEEGAEVELADHYRAGEFDTVICLHALKTAAIADRFRKSAHPPRIIVALTGTDIYGHRTEETIAALQHADQILCINPAMKEALPADLLAKTTVILQSAPRAIANSKPPRTHFRVIVLAHIRKEKNPMMFSKLLEALPADAKLRIDHYGAALDPDLSAQLVELQQSDTRYRWHHEVSHEQAISELNASDVLLQPSLIEGSPSVVSEAIALGVPLLASAIPSHIGLLGKEYPALFAPNDAPQAAQLLERCMRDAGFYQELVDRIEQLQPAFCPEAEQQALAQLVYRGAKADAL